MPDPLFSVIIATYNREHLLPRAIDSVLNQTCSDFEVLVIDNGSTDQTARTVRQYQDPRVSYVLNPRPSHSCDAPRNLGIQMARGALAAFLDDDDIWYPQRLQKVRCAFEEHPEVSAVCHNENRNVRGEVTGIIYYGPYTEDIHQRLLYEGNCLSSCGTTVRTSVLRELGGFDLRKEFDAAADYDFWLRMTAAGHKVYFIDEPLGEFTWTGENWCVADPAFDGRVAYLTRHHIQGYEKKGLSGISGRGARRLIRLYGVAARSFLRAGRIPAALRCAGVAAACMPRFFAAGNGARKT